MNNYNEIMEQHTILESDRLLLRPFSLADAEDVFLYASDELVTKYLTWPAHKNMSDIMEVVKTYYLDKPGIYAIELKSESKCIGGIDLRLFNDHDKASFGFVLNRHYWNKNYMTEALNLILDLSFSKLNLNRVDATHYVGNEGSGRVMQKCGMHYEGTGLQEVKIKGMYFDVVHYAILKDQWMNQSQK